MDGDSLDLDLVNLSKDIIDFIILMCILFSGQVQLFHCNFQDWIGKYLNRNI